MPASDQDPTSDQDVRAARGRRAVASLAQNAKTDLRVEARETPHVVELLRLKAELSSALAEGELVN